jgi:hypothetical protein
MLLSQLAIEVGSDTFVEQRYVSGLPIQWPEIVLPNDSRDRHCRKPDEASIGVPLSGTAVSQSGANLQRSSH